MGWDGGGNVTLLYDWSADAVSGPPNENIQAARMDTYWEDVAGAIQSTLNRFGENAAAANISFGGYSIMDVADAQNSTDITTMSTVGKSMYIGGSGYTGGAADAYTATAQFTSVVTGSRLVGLIHASNTGATTLNVNAGGAVAVLRLDGTPLQNGDLRQDWVFDVVFDGTNWRLISSTEAEFNGQYQGINQSLTEIAALTHTKGNVIATNGSNWAAQTVGTDGYVLRANSASGTGLEWAAMMQSGSTMFFYQLNPPVGWSSAVGFDQRALRVVSAGGVGGTFGGSTIWNSVFTSRTISAANMATHQHSVSGTSSTDPGHNHTRGWEALYNYYGGGTTPGNKKYASGTLPNISDQRVSYNGDHNHTFSFTSGAVGSGTAMDFNIQYADIVVGVKD